MGNPIGAGVACCMSALLLLVSFGGNLAAGGGVQAGTHAPGAQGSRKPVYSIKPSDIHVPADVPLGQYRRVTRPFLNWTLICDENLVSRKKVCNIVQEVVDAAGQSVFSWSLAATDEGAPVLILRAPLTVDRVDISIDKATPDIWAWVEGCTPTVCLAYLAVDGDLRQAIAQEKAVTLSYTLNLNGKSRLVSLRVPLKGLKDAVAAI